MRIFVAFLVMGTMVFAVALIAAVSALVAALPYLVAALVVVLLLRLLERRNPARRHSARVPVAPVRPVPAPPAGWVLVPVHFVPIEAPRPPVIHVLDETGNRLE